MHRLVEQYAEEAQALALAANRLAALGYVTSHGGNLSCRAAEDLLLLTPSAVSKRDIAAQDICFVDMEGKTVYAPERRRPTSETPFHRRVYARRPDLRAVVHAHPPVLTGFAIDGGEWLARPFLPEPAMEVGPMLRVPYEPPGSDALADALDGVLCRSNGFLLCSHGALMTSVEGPLRAVDLLEMMEGAAQSLLVARTLGHVALLSAEDLAEIGAAMPGRGLALPGLPGQYKTLEEAFAWQQDAF